MPAPLILAPSGPVLTEAERSFFREADPWGFIVFARNLEDADQIRALTDALRDTVGRDTVVLVDQEGGRVQRMWAPLVTDWVPPLDEAERLGPKAAQGMHLRYSIIAAELLALGIDVNCSPCLDIAGPDTHPFLRNRCLGTRRAQVAALGQVVASALLESGVLPVIKHMPGHGRGTTDSHMEVPRTDAPRAVLDDEDFAPFTALQDMPLGMTGHVIFDAIDPDAPATHSAKVIEVIRSDIGFNGLLMTDDLSMEALQGSVTDRALKAWEVGVEIVLHCNGHLDEMQALAASAPAMGPQARRRANAALAKRVTPAPADIDALKAEYDAL